MATQTNLPGYFGKAIPRKRKSQSDIKSFFKEADRIQKNDDDVVYVGGVCLYLPFITLDKNLFNRQSNVETSFIFIV